MSIVSVTPGESEYIIARINAFGEEASDNLRWLVPDVRRFGALPLYVGWTEVVGIRPDGAIVRWSTEDEYEGTMAVDSPILERMVMVVGAKKYPRLSRFVPARPPNAPTCDVCGGLGFLPGHLSIICSCGGVGWTNAGTFRDVRDHSEPPDESTYY